MDFEVVDNFARGYYLGENNWNEQLNFTPEQRSYIASLVLKARERDDKWIIDHLNADRFNRLIIIGEYFHIREKVNSIGRRLGADNQIITVKDRRDLIKTYGLNRDKTKVLLLYYASQHREFVEIGFELSHHRFQVITDHPML